MAAGKVWFPQLEYVRRIRQLKRSSAARPADHKSDSGDEQPADQVDVRIIEADEQDLTVCPTHASACLISLLSFHDTSSDMLLVASLFPLRRSHQYTLTVEFKVPTVSVELQESSVDVEVDATVLRPCTQALAREESSEASSLQPRGVEGTGLPRAL